MKTLTSILLILFFVVACGPKKPSIVPKAQTNKKENAYYEFLTSDYESLKGETEKSTAELEKLAAAHPDIGFFNYVLA